MADLYGPHVFEGDPAIRMAVEGTPITPRVFEDKAVPSEHPLSVWADKVISSGPLLRPRHSPR
jgi:hypothetical protein